MSLRLRSFTPPVTRFLASSPPDAPPDGVRATAALFGVPLDLTESFRSGTHAGPAAVRQISDVLETYSPMLERDLEADACLLDLGDVPLEGLPMHEALDAIAAAMAHAATLADLAVMVGGEHTGSLAGYRGIKRLHPSAALLHVDAHLDIREQYAGERLSHASWLYHAGAEFGFENIVQLGLRSGAREEWQLARQRTAWCSASLCLPPTLRALLQDRPIYLTIDIDVLDPGVAPGTGCPEPGGVTFRELADFLYTLSGLDLVAVDVMEVAPAFDPASITAAAAAKLVREAVLLPRRRSGS